MKKATGAVEKSMIPTLEHDRGAPRTLSELVYRKLRSDIVWGKLAPAAPLRSDELRHAYDIGISPLREALSRLVSERMVTSTGQRGFRVAPISKKDIIDVTETRLVVETAALKRSIENGDVAWESALVASHHALSRIRVPSSQGPEAELWAARHRALHLALLAACGSEWQLHLADLFFDQAERFRISAIRIPESVSVRDPAKEHQEIVAAALDRDSERAVELLERHYRSTMRLVLETIEARGGEDRD
jgi:GntR family carbon starvation induced transcriptional regulator